MSTLRSGPTWDIVQLFPQQGEWTVEDYLDLETNHLVEYVDGCLAVLAMPREWHQLIVLMIVRLLAEFTEAHAPGTVLPAPMKLRVASERFREPDILYLKREHSAWRGERFWKKADLVVEIVSPGRKERQRDLEDKPEDYARAGIPEYWIVDWEEQRITVLSLDGDRYRTHGVFGAGQEATSVLLPGFAVSLAAVFAAARASPPKRRKRSRNGG